MVRQILPLLLLLLLAGAAAARPCKTLFYLSSAATTTTYYHYNSFWGNPNTNSLLHNPRYITFIFTTTDARASRFPDSLFPLNFNSENSIDHDSEPTSTLTSSDLPLKLYSSVSNSIRERTKVIMSVVGSLLFGVSCGALTAAIMYFVWALFAPRDFDFEEVSSSDDDDGDNDDFAAAKRFGYVAIASKPKVLDDDLKKSVPMPTEAV